MIKEMKTKIKLDFDSTLRLTIFWLCIAILALYLCSSISCCAHGGNSRPRVATKTLQTLSDSIHEFEDGF